jgi:hypothetical protein
MPIGAIVGLAIAGTCVLLALAVLTLSLAQALR